MDKRELYSSHEAQRELLCRLTTPQPTIIAIEGGPSGGKTTLVEHLQHTAGDRPVICLPEAATDHILTLETAGVSVADLEVYDREGWLRFEADVLQTIVADLDAAKTTYAGTNAIIIADRCDIGAYVTEEEYGRLRQELGLAMSPMLTHVDTVYYLPSLAWLDPELYERHKASNPARHESVERAREVCAKNLAAIRRHPELHIAWGGEFSQTIASLTDQILHPERERELKLQATAVGAYDALFEGASLLSESAIEQAYHRFGHMIYRLRKVVTEHSETIHYFTCKDGTGNDRYELQRTITTVEYDLLRTLPQVGRTLHKRRSFVLGDDPLDRARKRAWTVDCYEDGTVHLETDLHDTPEAAALRRALPGFQPVEQSAEVLARSS